MNDLEVFKTRKMLLIANLYGSSLVKLWVMAYNKRKPENKDKGAVEIKL